jgi:hypothetical protein
MRLANTTDVPDERIREIIQFVKPNNLPTSIYDIVIRNGNGSGLFRPSADLITKYNLYPKIDANYTGISKRTKIIATVNNKSKFPIRSRESFRTIKLYWEQYDEKKQEWVIWYNCRFVPITRAYRKRHSHNNGNSNNSSGKINRGYLPCLLLSKEEAFVDTLAHEYRHFWQVDHPTKRGKVWGARGRFSERDACRYDIRKVRKWRRQQNNNTAGLGSWP